MTDDFDERFTAAVQAFWTDGRTAGSRGAVTGGGHIGALEDLVSDELIRCGNPPTAIHKKQRLELPGYYVDDALRLIDQG